MIILTNTGQVMVSVVMGASVLNMLSGLQETNLTVVDLVLGINTQHSGGKSVASKHCKLFCAI